jgi:hypothetical protein
MNRDHSIAITLTALGLAAGAGWAAPPGLKLVLNGAALSTQVRVVEGRPYAPLADLARAMNMGMVKKPYGYAFSPLAGPSRVGGPHPGKRGEELSTGKWGFKVLGVQETEEYLPRYLPNREVIRPAGVGDTLIAVQCRIRNLQKERQKISFDEGSSSGNTSLMDDQEHSYTPYKFDVHHVESPPSAQALPGSVVDFAVIFSVPKGTKAKELVYTLQKYDDRYTSETGTDVRITLSE